MSFWEKWLEANYPYIAMALAETDEARAMIGRLSDICKKHGVSFKAFIDILGEVNKND